MKADRLIAIVLLALTGCGGDPAGPEPLLEELPRALSPAENRVIEAGNGFTFGLFRTASQGLPPDSNAFLSPLSASFALGMTLNGARGPTFDAMRTVLGFGPAPLTEINAGYRDLIALLRGLDRATSVTIANSVWSNTGFPILPTFVTAAKSWFDAEARTVPFADPATVGLINGWVEDKTGGRIPKLIDALSSDEVAFLVNAIHFKGRWRTAFDPARTRPLPFRGADGVTRAVPTMRLDPGPLLHHAGAGYEAVDLLYGNGAFAMAVLLPSPGKTPADLIGSIDAAAWQAIVSGFRETEMALQLPKFRFDYARTLTGDLEALGMEIAFDPARADFLGMADVQPERLYLSRVLQKTFIDVNEEGTEAAAATGIGVGVTSAPPTLTVDRPFVFVIHERLTGAILFVGQVNVLRG